LNQGGLQKGDTAGFTLQGKKKEALTEKKALGGLSTQI